jgi:hypothetical protein
MYCPKCSQQQFPEEVRFCSRCGFQLVVVSQLFKTDVMAFIPSQYQKERLPLIKRQELRKGAKLIFLSFFSIIPSFIGAIIFDSPIPLIIPLITFLVGVAQILYYFLFGETILPIKKRNQSFAFSEYQNQANFQSAQNLPFSFVEPKPLNTSEFVQPPSITEPTSNLLRNKKEFYIGKDGTEYYEP